LQTDFCILLSARSIHKIDAGDGRGLWNVPPAMAISTGRSRRRKTRKNGEISALDVYHGEALLSWMLKNKGNLFADKQQYADRLLKRLVACWEKANGRFILFKAQIMTE
jgi:hypothetical protein